MHHALPVGIVQRIAHLLGDLQRLFDRQAAVSGQPQPQRIALDVGHREVQQIADFVRRENGNDVGMR